MLGLALLAVSLAASPRALPQADVVVHAPRLDALSGVTGFLQAAGRHAVALRPSSWAGELHPLLPLDVTRPATLEEAGVDGRGAATTSLRGEARVGCTALSDVERFEARVGERLAQRGPTAPVRQGGARGQVVRDVRGLHAGYLRRGREACSFASPEPLPASFLAEVAGLLGRAPPAPPRLGGLSGPLLLATPTLGLALQGDATRLTVRGTATRPALPPLAGAGPSPYAGLPSRGLLLARLRLTRAGLEASLAQLAARAPALCPSCAPASLAAVARALTPHLSGPALLALEEVQPQAGLRTAPARYQAVRHVLLAHLSRPEAARQALRPLLKLPGARATPDGVALPVGGGEAQVGVREGHLYATNAPEVLEALLAALPPAPGRQAHGAELSLSPRATARALGRLPLLEVLASPELVPLFAVATELGPLLAASHRVEAVADGGGRAVRFHLTWELAPPPAP